MTPRALGSSRTPGGSGLAPNCYVKSSRARRPPPEQHPGRLRGLRHLTESASPAAPPSGGARHCQDERGSDSHHASVIRRYGEYFGRPQTTALKTLLFESMSRLYPRRSRHVRPVAARSGGTRHMNAPGAMRRGGTTGPDQARWARATRLPIGGPVSVGDCPVDRAKEIVPCQTTETRSPDGSSSVPTG